MDTLGLYIHLPWCVQKCPYCDFNSHALHQTLPENDYLKALQADLDFEAYKVSGRTIGSIFFGGGTPSLFSERAIGKILTTITQYYRVADNVEITLEANPGTAESANFEGYRKAGVNRLSLGLQSLDDGMLKCLGRIHNSAESLAAYHKARRAGFENINLDMMFGLPGQSEQAALEDLSQAIHLDSEHLSWYQLTLEPNTAFARNPPVLPTADDVAAMQEAGLALLSEHNFTRYEVSAYCRSGRACQHNLNYWHFGDYLGVGAGAHGKLSTPEPTRYARHRHPRQYMASAGRPDVYQEVRPIAPNTLLFEFLMNRLRLTEGFNLTELKRQTGVSRTTFIQHLQPALDQGLLELKAGHCVSTAQGFRFLNDILLMVLPEQDR